MTRPLALVTNDDGISSYFLRVLVEALREDFDVVVVAPVREKSWIGRAMTRHGSIPVERADGWPCPAWSAGGTPTDCVNIAIGDLLERRPDIVLSGINIGYNTTVPLVYSSGTVAGALEGAAWGVPAVAVSQALDRERFQQVSAENAVEIPEIRETLIQTAAHAAGFAAERVRDSDGFEASAQANWKLSVHNLNFPFPTRADSAWRRTVPARLKAGCFFQSNGNPGEYAFAYRRGECAAAVACSDREAVGRGEISWSVLNFGEIGQVQSDIDSSF